MTNLELQELLKQYPDGLSIMIEIFNSMGELDSMDLNIHHMNPEKRIDAQYICISGKGFG
jgi:hypothetical protein